MNNTTFLKSIRYKLKYREAYKANLKLAEYGTNIKLLNKGSLISGENLRLRANTSVVAIGGRILIGDNVFLNRNCNIICREQISIGNNVSVGHNVCIIDHDHLFDKEKVFGTEYKTGKIIIGDGCWLGSNVIVLKGASIGEGCVIGAGTIVKGTIPPHSIVTMGRELNIRPIT